MKKALLLIPIVAVLVSCGGTPTVESKAPNGFTIVSEDTFKDEFNNTTSVIVIEHIKTGCQYSLVNVSEGVAMTQLLTKYGKPYCE